MVTTFLATDVVFETEDLEVGSGFVGITINVSDSEGEFIGEVMPGLIRFDRLDSTASCNISSARSEIDIMSRYYGDIYSFWMAPKQQPSWVETLNRKW